MVISEHYREQNRELHKNEGYGVSGQRWAPFVRDIANSAGSLEILDYGCGKQTLKDALPSYKVIGYDPSIDGMEADPSPCAVVTCTDVLEHIEPELLNAVLDDLKRVVTKVGFFVVATRPAMKTLPDGRNAHLIVEEPSWWLPKLFERFHVKLFQDFGGEFVIIVRPKDDHNEDRQHHASHRSVPGAESPALGQDRADCKM